LCFSTADFEAQMRYLRTRGYQAIPLDEVPLAASDNSPWKKPVAITFDDGYRDTYTHAFPILQKHGFTATVMLVSECIGGRNTWNGDASASAPLLSVEEIREMEQCGIRFGAHTATHPSLPDISFAQVRSELADSKAQLEQLLGQEIRTLAYPYGRCTPDVCRVAEEVGFEAAFATEHGALTLHNFSRIDAARCSGDTFAWRLKVSGIYDKLRMNRTLRKLNELRKRLLR